MPRPKSSKVYKYFKLNVITGKYICQVDSCSTEIYPHAKNCERHIEKVHYKFFNEHFEKKKPQKRSIQTNCHNNDKDIPIKIAKKSYLQKNTLNLDLATKNTTIINIKMTAEKLLEACVDLVTLDGRPLDIIDDIGFRKIINPILVGMGNKTTINKKDVMSEVDHKAIQIVNEIKKLTENRLVCLKMDHVFKKNKSILYINIQVSSINSTVAELKTLAIIELNEQYEAADLQKRVHEILSNFGIKETQIYTITTDKNFIKIDNLMKDDHNFDEHYIEDETVTENDLEVVESKLLILENSLLGETGKSYVEDLQLKPVTTVLRCAAHSLRLCVEDVMKTDAVLLIVIRAREVVKKLRTLTLSRKIESLYPNSLKAIIDVPIKWESTYDMLKRLDELKNVCNDLSESYVELHLNKSEWDMIENVIISFSPAKIASVKVQKENLTIGDFHGVWLKCYGDTMTIGSEISKLLCTAMELREKSLFENSVYTAGLYLDPRYQCLLNEGLRYQAKLHLLDVWNVMNSFSIGQSEIHSSQDKDINPETDAHYVNDSLEAYIRTKTNMTLQYNLKAEKFNSTMPVPIPLLIESFDGIPRIHNSLDIRTYWENEKFTRPELYKLAQILLNVPVTQVSMEKMLAGLKSNASCSCFSQFPQMKENVSIIRNNYYCLKK